MVGIRNTLDENQLVFSPNATDAEIDPEMSLVIYDENDNVIREIKLAEVNKPELQIGETAAYFGYLERVYIYDDAGNHVIDGNGEYAIRERIYHEPTLAQGDTYLIENGELVIYQAADNSYFGKGVITASQNVLTVPRKSFAIVSRNDEISSLLANGVKVRVQYNLVGEFADVTDALGCADALVLDGDWCEYYDSESYYTTRAPRTLIGQKADGTICLLTMDGRQPEKNFYGTNQQEIDTVLEQLNITDAFLLDGGGSSTFFVRENNKFVIKNSPSDGHQRSVSNGFLIVTDKDESVKLSKIEPQQTAAKFYIDTEKVDERVSKVYLQIDDSNLVPFIDGEVTIARLDSNTEYNYVLYYRTLAGDVIPTTNIGAFKTLKVVPSVSLGEFTSDEDYLYPKIVVDDPDKALLMARITVNNKKYNFDLDDDTKQIKISIPNDATSIDCVINYAYQLGDKEEIVEGELRLNYELPSQGEPAPIKKGCGAKAVYIVGFGSLALIGVILLKRKQY